MAKNRDFQPSRRRLLITASMIAAVPVCGRDAESASRLPAQEESTATAIYDTIVVGAGASGLGAGRTLADAGKNVLLLEARDRVGGRMWTHHTAMSIPIELGAELIHGLDASTWPLARKQHISTFQVKRVLGRNNVSGQWIALDSPEANAFPEGRPNIKLPLPLARDGETAQQYLTRVGITEDNYPFALWFLTSAAEQFNNIPATDVVDIIAALLDGSYKGDDGDNFRVIGGYDQILKPVRRDLVVQFNTVVERIECSAGGVVIHAKHGAEQLALKARTCIVTLPAGVLQQGSVEFFPPLSADKRAAINQFEYNAVAKILLEFSRRVMPVNAEEFHDYSCNPPVIWDASTGTPGYDGQVVVGWATGDCARKLLALPEEERYTATLETVRRMTGIPDLHYVRAATHDWTQDEFARGAYVLDFGDHTRLYAPVKNTLFWAGVVTSTISSSYDSGRRAAGKVLLALRQLRS